MKSDLHQLLLPNRIHKTDPSGILVSTAQNDDFYEGKYLSNIKFNPSKPTLFSTVGLWIVNSGYLYTIKKHFKENAVLIEFGCAGGVDYLGSHYQMIGIDISLSSLKYIVNKYSLCIQGDVTSSIPLQDNTVDGIVSSFFWEHMDASNKRKILTECLRVLKPNGKMVFLYDVESKNTTISLLKKENINLFMQQFIEQDGHVGYDTIPNNKQLFEEQGFSIIKNKGFEKTIFQSRSVYIKMKEFKGYLSVIGKLGTLVSSGIFNYPYLFFLRTLDTIFHFLPEQKARFVMTIVKKQTYGFLILFL